MLDGNNTKKTDYSTTGIITKKEEEPTVKLVASAKADARNNRDQPAPSDGVDGQKTTGEGNEESGVASGKASKKDDGSNDDAAAEAWIARAVLKVQWTDQEDSIVIDAVTNSSEQPFRLWHDLAQRLPGRVGPQIMVRWRNQLNPNINHLPFSREDDLLLWEGHKKLGNRWVEISEKCFNSTRSERHIQNRWNSVSFKKFISTKDSLIETVR
ncbi:hypothetical protein FRACYDRAFT_180636 [Fragilariopsis cylindrus CCMP1102]|uniref:Myb-like domain-containing protein n=1 Tax=Fragilariopsis cylindrus CCMP1102 TaxID=635003 RepID=A0A1E7FRX4_9STRA|nr:hypothetical protein FRACYDRAFT_180636 [Fragilariopsis cylindrus CCMP1102]|eukprot:OEU20896.1 hypothetical protein FRACYDRAFT_180636 [Fragilariopsis cylindrus CCMP1102]